MKKGELQSLFHKCSDKHPVLIKEIILESGVDLMQFWLHVDSIDSLTLFEQGQVITNNSSLIRYRTKVQKDREKISNVIAEMYKKDVKATHYENELVHQYKVAAGLEKNMTAKERKEISSKRYEAYLSLPKRVPTKSEIETVLFLLKPYPEALKEATIALNK